MSTDRRWRPTSWVAGTAITVQPINWGGYAYGWQGNPYHRRGIAKMGAMTWRALTGTGHRRLHPQTPKAMVKAMEECQAWCDRQNDAEEAAAALMEAAVEAIKENA